MVVSWIEKFVLFNAPAYLSGAPVVCYRAVIVKSLK